MDYKKLYEEIVKREKTRAWGGMVMAALSVIGAILTLRKLRIDGREPEPAE